MQVHTTWDDIGVEMVEEYDATTDQLLLRKVQACLSLLSHEYLRCHGYNTTDALCIRADSTRLTNRTISCGRSLLSVRVRTSGRLKLAKITRCADACRC